MLGKYLPLPPLPPLLPLLSLLVSTHHFKIDRLLLIQTLNSIRNNYIDRFFPILAIDIEIAI